MMINKHASKKQIYVLVEHLSCVENDVEVPGGTTLVFFAIRFWLTRLEQERTTTNGWTTKLGVYYKIN